MKLTPDLILVSPQFTNPLHDREIDLRGHKIPAIENLGMTLDQFDTIDLSDNDIKVLDGFPQLRRLKTVLLCNNRITRVADDLAGNLPAIEELVLSNNNLEELHDLDPLSSLPSLRRITLMRNPVAQTQHYRLYLIHKVPQLTLIDFRRVKPQEREEAAQLFSGAEGKKLQEASRKKRKAEEAAESKELTKQQQQSAEEVARIKAAILNATSLEEIKRLQQQLQAGYVPEGEAAASMEE